MSINKKKNTKRKMLNIKSPFNTPWYHFFSRMANGNKCRRVTRPKKYIMAEVSNHTPLANDLKRLATGMEENALKLNSKKRSRHKLITPKATNKRLKSTER